MYSRSGHMYTSLAHCCLMLLCLCLWHPDSPGGGEGGSEVECRDRLEEYMRVNRVPFEAQHHPRAVTAQEVAASEHVPGKMLAKTVIVLADGEMVMLSLPAPYQVDLDKAAAMLGVEVAHLAE